MVSRHQSSAPSTQTLDKTLDVPLSDTLTHEQVKAALTYNPETGKFYWLESSVRGRPKGVAGTSHSTGYEQIRLNGKSYLAHRLAWFYMYGTWPTYEVDHINGDRADNRIANLREVTHRQNAMNRIEHRLGKLPGAYKDRRWGRWQARIKIANTTRSLGTYDTAEEAHAAYLQAVKELT